MSFLNINFFRPRNTEVVEIRRGTPKAFRKVEKQIQLAKIKIIQRKCHIHNEIVSKEQAWQ